MSFYEEKNFQKSLGGVKPIHLLAYDIIIN